MLIKRIFKIARLLPLLGLLIGCSGEDGKDGLNGLPGQDGRNALITTVVEQPGANCAFGGFIIRSGTDTNANGILDPSETSTTEYLCNANNTGHPYTAYVSLLSQSGLAHPSATVLENTLGLSMDWVREAPGKYLGTFDKNVVIGKTVIFFTTPTTHTGVRGNIVGNNQVRLELQNGTNAFKDDFSDLSFELRQYD